MAGTVLAGDLGGTSIRLGLFRVVDGEPRLQQRRTYASQGIGTLEEAIDRLFGELGVSGVDAACFGVAGPVIGNRARLTNLGWWVDSESIARHVGTSRVEVVNDLVAAALGLSALEPADLAVLHRGATASGGPAVLVGAGTGLGIAFLAWSGDDPVVLASEGGHMSFAPRDSTEWELQQYLARRLGGRVSIERVVSGPGLHNILQFLVEAKGAPVSSRVSHRLASEDPARVVAEAAQQGDCPTSARALDLFASAYGAVAGDLALLAAAFGGVFLTGGVAAKSVDKLKDGAFLRAYLDKGRLSEVVERIPVSIVLREDTGFLGAARRAAALLE
jgi:glucokinase